MGALQIQCPFLVRDKGKLLKLKSNAYLIKVTLSCLGNEKHVQLMTFSFSFSACNLFGCVAFARVHHIVMSLIPVRYQICFLGYALDNKRNK